MKQLQMHLAVVLLSFSIAAAGAGGDQAERVEGAPAPTTTTTDDLVKRFLSLYERELKRVSAIETNEDFSQSMKELPGVMDEALKSETWALHCRITEVLQDEDGRDVWIVKFERPLEFAACEGWTSRTRVTMRLKGQVFEPGDLLTITGTPRFAASRLPGRFAPGAEPEMSGTSVLQRRFDSPRFARPYACSIDMPVARIKITKANRAE